MPELLRQCPPGDVVNREVMQRFEKETVILGLRAARRQAGSEHLQRQLPIRVIHLRGHRRPSVPVGNP